LESGRPLELYGPNWTRTCRREFEMGKE